MPNTSMVFARSTSLLSTRWAMIASIYDCPPAQKLGTARARDCDLGHKSALLGKASFLPSSVHLRAIPHSPCDYISTTLLTTYRDYARTIPSLAHRGASPETILKAERGVASCGRRLVTVGPGRPGKSPARHYDLAARSSLHGVEGNCPPL